MTVTEWQVSQWDCEAGTFSIVFCVCAVRGVEAVGFPRSETISIISRGSRSHTVANDSIAAYCFAILHRRPLAMASYECYIIQNRIQQDKANVYYNGRGKCSKDLAE